LQPAERNVICYLRHQLSANYVWDLPVKVSKHWLQSLLGGWQIAGTFFYRTGFPFSIVNGQQEASLAGNNLTVNGTFLTSVLYEPTPGSPTSFGASCATTACRRVSTTLRHMLTEFSEFFHVSWTGLLIHASVGTAGGLGALRT